MTTKSNKKTPRERARSSGLPMLEKDHPLYKSGYVIGGKRLKGNSKKGEKPRQK